MGVRLPLLALRILLGMHTLTTKFDSSYHLAKYYEYRRRDMEYVAKGGPVECAHCGSTERLEFDHVDPSLKSFDVCRRKSHKRDDYLAELDKCQILCNACHRRKTASENSGFTHGTYYAFAKAKCDCAECQCAKRVYNDRRSEKRRGGTRKREPYGRPSACGELLNYRRGCRCGDCRAANAAAARELKARKASPEAV